ncbi:cortical protein KAR9-domain-containing protein [Boeremia exigua]|uniref:cortical protein KAR9-domain-containing protein n=1 Tax=Boeremia exigua TaxID=749465 RepID=UPI001E8E4A85|nr:cortical protein KAR9-domain-containing protein [Boeremia exigua]KAH6643933.1 cortical protein KAR9-domain-containing protein [Boeremia exigua]
MTQSSSRGPAAAENDPMNNLRALQPADSPPKREVAATPPNPAPANSTASSASTASTASSPPRTQLRRTASNSSSILESTTKLARNVSPALLARMKFLNHASDTASASKFAPAPTSIGRIAEEKIKQLDDFHSTKRTFSIERRGTTWSSGTGSQLGTPLIPQLTGESVPPLVMERDLESDISSVVSTSDRVLPSESDVENDHVLDMQKYRLPDITKTKTLSQTIAEPDAAPVAHVDRPPTPPPKDTPSPHFEDEVSVLDSNNTVDVASYFSHRHLHRTNSIYTLSKASFTNQIQQLTSMKLPPTTIASEITALPSSTLAGRALHSSANDIRRWMAKATEVLNGLDADDDVEWAAAAGREGLADVDAAIGKFEGLVTVYITAIEDLQSRPDISALPLKDQTTLVTQMEEIVGNWSEIKRTLKGIKNQVEIAMEWEELWNSVLGEIGAEVETLSRLVFEMEERRHRVISDSVAESAEKFDIADLETIVEETPRQNRTQNNRLSMPPTLTVMSPTSPIPQIEQESSRLLEIFAKLQPLRASLDFLPMRLASFEMRASNMFPSACDELMRRKDHLEKQEKNLEAEADALREELGEDKWVHSFRQAGSKAVAMYDSCMKSIERLQQAINDADEEKLGSRISTYQDKRDHYPPSMKRVLELIDIEMKHRSTVNGEILRIQQDVRQKMSDLEAGIERMDAILDEVPASRKLRDSVSTVLSMRTEASSTAETPSSSPASSVVMSRKGSDYGIVTPAGRKSRQSSTSTTKSSAPPNRRYSSLPVIPGSVPRKSLPSTYLEPTIARTMASTPTRMSRSSTPATERPAHKPRWNTSTKVNDTAVSHYYKALPATPLRSASGQSSIPVRSALGRTSMLSPSPSAQSTAATPMKSSMRRPLASTLQAPATPLKSPTFAHGTPSTGTPSSIRRVTIADDDNSPPTEESPVSRRTTRPPSAMKSRRTSLLPTPASRTLSTTLSTPASTPARTTSRLGNTEEGRRSRAGDGRSSRVSGRQSSAGDRPGWR